MNHELKSEAVSLEDVDINNLNIYDPTVSTVVTPQFAVGFYIDGNLEDKSWFVCKAVSASRVLFELPDDLALFLQNAPMDERDEDADLTDDDLELSRALREFNVTAVRLGLLQPDISHEQIEALPIEVVRDLADKIVATPKSKED